MAFNFFCVARLLSSPVLVERLGIALLVVRMRRVKQFIEVEILQNSPRFLLVLLRFLVFIAFGLALLFVSLVRTDSIAHKLFLTRRVIKLSILQQILKAVSAVVSPATLPHFFVVPLPTAKFEFWTFSTR